MGKRILVVDDEPGNLEVARRRLEGLGQEVTSAENAEAALCLIEGGVGFDGIISDYNMPPGRNGLDLLRAVRSNPDFDQIRFILASSDLQTPEGVSLEQAAHELGARFLHKPYNKEALIYELSLFS